MVDLDPGQARIPLVELGKVGIRHPHVEPGPVVHRVAHVRELPVDDPGDLPAVEHEVAGSGVPLDQHRPRHHARSVRPQPRAPVTDERIEVRHAVVGELCPHLEVEPRVVLRAARSTEAVERQRLDVEVVEGCQRVDERSHGLAARVIVERGEVATARNTFHQQRGAAGRDTDDARHRHVGGFERAVHHRFLRR